MPLILVILSILLVVGISICLSCYANRGTNHEIEYVKVYFGVYKNHQTDCICNDPIIRKIRKTSKIEEAAFLALEELVKGTTKEENEKGYGGCIPAGGEIARFKEWYLSVVEDYQKTGKFDDYGKKFLSPEGIFTPWGDRVRVRGVKIIDNIAYADFSKELYSYGGGSCRIEGIETSIMHTLKQFSQMRKVVILIESNQAELEP